MSTGFGMHYPTVHRVTKRDKLTFLATVGLVVSLVMLIILLSDRKGASESSPLATPKVTSNVPIGAITLYAPSRPIQRGQKLGNFKFKPIYWPRNSIPDGAVRDLHELKGKYAKREIRTSSPITRDDFSKQPHAETLNITPGMRAITISINEESGLEGWAKPGATVDVILTYNSEGQLQSKVIVEKARVLSLGGDKRTPDAVGSNRKQATPERTITLEVTPMSALSVRTSKELGKLSLMMRSQQDTGLMKDTRHDERDIYGSDRLPITARSKTCGRIKVAGSEYIVECGGEITRLVDPENP